MVEFADDIATSLWGDLSAAPRFRRGLQIAFLDEVREILQSIESDKAKDIAAKAALTGAGLSPAFVSISLATGANTVFPAWARNTLPEIKARLDATNTSDRSDKLHFEEMAWRIEDILTKQN